jgi:hypothetical protein
MKSGKRQNGDRTVRGFLFGLFSSGWAVMVAVSEYWHTSYISAMHRADFAEQTPEFFWKLDLDYRIKSSLFFVIACLWLTLVLFVWARKLSAHIERTRPVAETPGDRLPAGDR